MNDYLFFLDALLIATFLSHYFYQLKIRLPTRPSIVSDDFVGVPAKVDLFCKFRTEGDAKWDTDRDLSIRRIPLKLRGEWYSLAEPFNWAKEL